MNRNCALIAGVWLTLTISAAIAQQSGEAVSPIAPAPYQLQVTTRLVVLDITVTDRQGHLVNNLSPNDFQVYEDKALQSIRSFDSPKEHTGIKSIQIDSTADLDQREPNAPVSIIVLDEINTHSEDESFARYSLKKYLNTQGDVLDQPTMLLAVDANRFMVLRDYTTSKKEILNALDHHFAALPWRLGSKNFQGEQVAAALASLMQVAQATSGHPGHKNMIWIGRGFPNLNPANIPPDIWDTIQKTIKLCINSLRDSRITLYTVDSAGVVAAPPDPDDDGFYDEDPFGGQINFTQLAVATGGQAFFGRNDLDHLIATSVIDGANFYTLTYSPSNKGDMGKPFRNIQIRMKNPDFIAVTRTGYYASPTPTTPVTLPANDKQSEQMAALLNAANSTMTYDGVHISVSADTKTSGDFKISVTPSEIPWQPSESGPATADVTLLVETFDKKGVSLRRTATVVTLKSPSTTPSQMPMLLPASVPITPAVSRIRFVVRVNGTGKIGADTYYITSAGHH